MFNMCMFTETPAHNPSDASSSLKREFLSIADAVKVSSLSRSTLYKLMDSGSVRNVSLRKRGSIKGRRLIVADSLTNYLYSLEGK